MLAAGGNAFDAVIAAHFAACVAEPALASLGGGGFLNARTADGDLAVYDFFAQTPSRRNPGEIDFYAAVGNFGGATQEFHLGRGSIACPGTVRGLFSIHRDLGSLPMEDLVAPAVRLAREGVAVNREQAKICTFIAPLLLATPESRKVFGGSESATEVFSEGDRYTYPELADFLESLAREGEDLFYRGEPAAALARDCADGGHLTLEDLHHYRAVRRKPLKLRFGDAVVATNPAPAVGGVLVAFGLRLLDGQLSRETAFGSRQHLALLTRAMVLTRRARADTGVDAQPNQQASQRLLADEYLEEYRRILSRHAPSFRGTTQITAADADGHLASMTLSNGEGSGYVIPGTGIVLNNMLGEEDLSPLGFDAWTPGCRLSSMMAPTIAQRDDGSMIGLGTGGSNRIRTAVLQTLVNLLALGLDLETAIRSPRVHLEGDLLHLEPGFPDASTAEMPEDLTIHHWDHQSLFFGGVHAVTVSPDGHRIAGVGDPRRGGVVAESG